MLLFLFVVFVDVVFGFVFSLGVQGFSKFQNLHSSLIMIEYLMVRVNEDR